jgi:hypothetical protein
MRILFAMSLFALIGCAGNKPVAEHNNARGDLRCELLPKMIDVAVEVSKTSNFYTVGGEKCNCIETMTCNNEDYCIAIKCPDTNETTSIFKY